MKRSRKSEDKKPVPPAVSEYMSRLARQQSENMSESERRERARQAVKTRWAKAKKAKAKK